MEPGTKLTETTHRDSDAEVGLLLYKTGRAVKQFLLLIGRAISSISKGILAILLFLFRNFLWLLIGFAAGLLFGLYQVSQNTSYSSEMTVQANFGSSRELYNTVTYVNALISGSKTKELSTLFNITPGEAAQLSDVTVEPEISEVIVSEMYREQFLEPEFNKKVRLDTFWTRTVKYEDFKDNLTEYDYPLYRVTAKSTNATLFPKLGAGITAYINSNPLFNEIKQQQVLSNSDEEKLLVASIGNLDSLRNAYNQRLLKGEPAVPNSNQMMVLQSTKEQAIPELDLYDKVLELQDRLEKTRNRSITEKNAIIVQSPFSPIGKKVSLVTRASTPAIYGLLAALAVLLLIGFYRWLVVFESSQSKGRKPAKA